MYEKVPREPSRDEVLREILGIQKDVAQMGGNESEINDIGRVVEAVRDGILQPSKGLEMARLIRDKKYSDH